MIRVALTTVIATKGGGNVWFPAEVDGCDTIAQIFDRLIADHVIMVSKLGTAIVESHRVIKDRTPEIVGVMGVVTITPLHLELTEEQ